MDTSIPLTVARINAATDAELDTLNTRHLLTLYKQFSLNVTCNHYEVECGYETENTELQRATLRLKTIVDRRPHVPNKKEAKALRQAAAKKKR